MVDAADPPVGVDGVEGGDLGEQIGQFDHRDQLVRLPDFNRTVQISGHHRPRYSIFRTI